MERLWAPLAYFPRVAASLGILLAFWVGGLIARRLVRHLGLRAELDKGLVSLLARGLEVALLAFGAITALGTLGVNVAALVAGLGLAGFALGFALRDVLSNAIAGVLILAWRPFRCDDRIAAAGFEGVVADIDLRFTTLLAEEGKVLIPNSTLLTNVIVVRPCAGGERGGRSGT
jgi:small-conductance mechanosensitive channel